MQVTEVRTFLVQPTQGKTALFVKVNTDAGIHGWGEAYTLTGREPALERLIGDLGEYLVGQDPFQIKHLTHVLWRDVSIKRGGFDFYCAVSGLEIALWDIVGKALNTPVYNLLGGLFRDKIRVYTHPFGDGGEGTDALVQRVRNVVDRGHTAVKFDPFPGPWQMIVDTAVERTAIERVAAVREAVGSDVEILIEVHRRLAPMHAIRVAQAIEQYKPLWFEEPTPAENLDATAAVRAKTTIPIVVGEARYTKAEFREVFVKEAADIVNPDICNVGGLLEMREIAAMAEAFCVALAPHGNNSTTVGLAASLHVAACAPNFMIMEYFSSWEQAAEEIAINPLRPQGGKIAMPDGAGLGIELDEDALGRMPYRGGQRRTLRQPKDEWP